MKSGRVMLLCVCIATLWSGLASAAPSPIEKGPRLQEDLRRMRENTGTIRERIDKDLQMEWNVVYGSERPERQMLDLYVLKNRDKPMPLVVWIHGGAWLGGDKRPCPMTPLLYDGFAVASINYRFSNMAIFPAQIHDCKAAIRWLRANAAKYNIDPNHIGVAGASAGGHLAALLGTTNGNKELEGTVGDYPDASSDVQAVCDWFGPSDFFTMPVDKQQFNGQDPVVLLLGSTLSEKKELAELASPFYQANKKTVSFLIMHGDRDTLVPVEQSKMLHEKLKAAGTDSTLLILEGQGHGFSEETQAFKQVKEFFERTLKPSIDSK